VRELIAAEDGDNTWRKGRSSGRHALAYAGTRKLEMGIKPIPSQTNIAAALLRSVQARTS